MLQNFTHQSQSLSIKVLTLFILALSAPTYGQLQVDFTADSLRICPNTTVQFTDLSTSSSPIVDWQWKRNNVVFANIQNPKFNFDTSGFYDICLRVRTASNQLDSICKTAFIEVLPLPQIDFTAADRQGCTNVVVDFQNTSSTPLSSWQWIFGDGNSNTTDLNPSHPYLVAGVFTVTLIGRDANGCQHFEEKKSYIQTSDPPVAVDIQLQGNFANNHYCHPPVEVDFNAAVFGGSGPYTYRWDFGDNTPTQLSSSPRISHTYTAAGDYFPTVEISDGICTTIETRSLPVQIKEGPVVDFDIVDSTTCTLPFEVELQNKTVAITAWEWDFGDDSTSTDYNTKHLYITDKVADSTQYIKGYMPITLRASNAFCEDSLQKRVFISNIYGRLGINLSGCAPITTTLRHDLDSNFPLDSFFWDWDFGNQSSLEEPSATFPDSGSYTIRLRVVDSLGCDFEDSTTVFLGILPVIDSVTVDGDTSCGSGDLSYTAYGSDYIKGWTWTFSDGSSNKGNSIVHPYEDTGWVNITVKADFNGCESSFSLDSIYVMPPIARYNYNGVCGSTLVEFRDTSIGGQRFLWDFGDLTTQQDTSTQMVTSYNYPGPGLYEAVLYVWNDSTGCMDSMMKELIISDPQGAFTSADTICVGDTLYAYNQSLNVRSIAWLASNAEVFDRMQDTGKIVFKRGGIQTLSLIVTSGDGCAYQVDKDIYVSEVKAAVIKTPGYLCQEDSLLYRDISSTLFSPIVSRTWNGQTGVDSLSVYYNTRGEKYMELKVENAFGCRDSLIDTFVVNIPRIYINANQHNCRQRTVTLIAVVRDNLGGIDQLDWDFGDGNTAQSSSTVVFHQYAQAGVYFPTVRLRDTFGCVTEGKYLFDSIFVYDPKADFVLDSNSSFCVPTVMSFRDNSTDAASWSWDFGVVGGSSILENPTFSYSASGQYQVSLTIQTAQGGCQATTTKLIELFQPQGDLILDSSLYCKYSAVDFDILAQVSDTVFFFDGRGNSDTLSGDSLHRVQEIYEAIGVYQPYIVIKDVQGCTARIARDSVEVIGALSTNVQGDSSLCLGELLSLQLGGDSMAFEAEWLLSTPLGVDTVRGATWTLNIDSVGRYAYRIALRDTLNCRDTLSGEVQVNGLPSLKVLGDSIGCRGDSIELFAQMDGSSSVQWSGPGIWTCDTCTQTVLSLDSSTYVLARVEDSLACWQEDSLYVEVEEYPTLQYAMKDTVVCRGDTVRVEVMSNALQFNWQLDGVGWMSDSTGSSLALVPDSSGLLRLSISGDSLCSLRDSLVLQVHIPLVFSLANQQLCLGDSLQGEVPAGFVQPQWSGLGLTCDTCMSWSFVPEQGGLYSLEARDSNACVWRDSFELGVDSLGLWTIAYEDSVCRGDSLYVELNSGQTLDVLWIGAGDTLSGNTLALQVDSTVFYEVVISSGLCQTRDTVLAQAFRLGEKQVQLAGFCPGDSVLFDLQRGQYVVEPTMERSWQWRDSSQLVFAPLTSRVYSFVNPLALCGADSLNIFIERYDVPTLLLEDTLYQGVLGSEVQLELQSNAGDIFWWPSKNLSCDNCLDPILLVEGDERIYVQVQNDEGCLSVDSLRLRALWDCSSDLVFLPNAFTPNGDGDNDVFRVRSSSISEIEQMSIYNRWGELMWETKDMNQAWDGRYRGKDLAPDVFGYWLQFRCPSTGELIQKKGNVTLLR